MIRTVIMIIRTICFLSRKVLQADAQDRTERNVNIVSIPKAQSRHRCAFAAQTLGAVQRCFVHRSLGALGSAALCSHLTRKNMPSVAKVD